LILRFIFLGFFVINISFADDIFVYESDSKIVIKQLGKKLKTTVKSIIKESGPVVALEYCNIAALELTKEVSFKNDLVIRRTSLRYRNENNIPDLWEFSVLKSFEKRLKNGEEFKSINTSAIVKEDGKNFFRYMQVIPVGKPCLTCHGTNIKSEILSKIRELYPKDKATGFRIGEIRGAFSVKIPLVN